MSRGSAASSRFRRALVGAVVVCVVATPAQALASHASPRVKSQKAKVRAELRKQVRKNPGVVRRRAFLRKAALVNFKLPVTIRLRNTCRAADNTVGGVVNAGQQLTPPIVSGVVPTGGLNCATQGTALNQRTIPSAHVNLGPSLGSRDIAIGGSLSAVVEFNDTYDGGALGNVNIKIIQDSSKFLTTSSVPLLWNGDITQPGTRNDANFLKANSHITGLSETGIDQGCSDFTSTPTYTGGIVPTGYDALYHGLTPTFNPSYPTGAGVPGFPYYDPSGPGTYVTPAGFLPNYPGVDGIDQLKSGGVVGNNDWIGTNPFPFPTQTAPSTTAGGAAPGSGTGTAGGTVATYGNVADTVLRTNALHLAIAQGGISVDMSTGKAVTAGALPTAQGSQNITLGYSGGQANLFGNIPGKNVGIDVTVNLATTINGIARIMDQDMFSTPLVSGNAYPAVIFPCHQVWTSAAKNYIPGVRLTGSLRIAPAITKDGKVRIAKATVSSDANNPDRVALTACLTAASAYVDYNDDNSTLGFADQNTAPPIPYHTWSGLSVPPVIPAGLTTGGLLPVNSSLLPVFADSEKFDPADPSYSQFGGNAPSTTPCNSDPYKAVQLAGLTGTVGGLPEPGVDMQAAGVNYNGSQASVAGDITVNPIDVDVLLGDVGNAN